ncbi:MAG: SusD/RagB family nutrient-binding outer membrane lipoprotein [Prevotellaceae bacterium]|jgi:hypothetical protein|nr:SusD/RagB family nutrient-binding outer membrane lipoprotein [Prevotellaceae bacterium]
MKKYNYKTILIAISAGILTLFASCTGLFEEYNKHQTNPGPGDMTTAERVGILFPGMLYLMHNFQENDNQMIEQMIGNQYGGYMATTNNWQGTNFGTFNPSANWVEYPFNKLFTGFYANYFQISDITQRKGYIYAWANIVRVAVMLRVTDMYGPIPYTKMGGGQLAVEYDDVQTVYHAMIDDLNNSIAALTSFVAESQGKANPMADYDLVYNGDFSKWIKFANSLKLRMAVRIGLVDTDYAKQMMDEAIAGGTIETNADNAFLPTEDNPYRKSAFDWGDLAVNATLSAYMNGWSDPRRAVYMTQTADFTYRGVRMGINNISKDTYSSNLYSKPNFTHTSPLLVFCAAETYFLKAEAALRGWIAGGEAQARTFYEQGITVSMEQHGVPIGTYLSTATNPASYNDPTPNTTFNLASTTNGGAVTVSWTSGTTTNARLEKIITQKWLANYPLGFETWNDFRRTSYPRIMPSVNNLSSVSSGGIVNNPTSINPNSTSPTTAIRLVRRLPYPVSEYNGNPANVGAAVANLLEGPDEFATNLWWARKQP